MQPNGQSNAGIRLVMPNPDGMSNKHRPLGSYSSGTPSSGTPTNILNPVIHKTTGNSVHGLRLDVDDDEDEEELAAEDEFYRFESFIVSAFSRGTDCEFL